MKRQKGYILVSLFLIMASIFSCTNKILSLSEKESKEIESFYKSDNLLTESKAKWEAEQYDKIFKIEPEILRNSISSIRGHSFLIRYLDEKSLVIAYSDDIPKDQWKKLSKGFFNDKRLNHFSEITVLFGTVTFDENNSSLLKKFSPKKGFKNKN